MSWALWTFSVRCHCVNLKVTLKLSARKHWIEMLSWHVCVFFCVCGREGGREVEKGSRQLSDIWFFLRNWYWDTSVFSYLANGDFGPWSKLRPERCQRRDLGNRAWIMEMCEKNMSTGCINICVTVINQISNCPSPEHVRLRWIMKGCEVAKPTRAADIYQNHQLGGFNLQLEYRLMLYRDIYR